VKLACERWAVEERVRRVLETWGFGVVRTAVELEGLGVLLGELVGSVGDGILDTTSLASLASEEDMESVDEEGGCGGHEDEARKSVSCLGLRLRYRHWDCPLPVFSGELQDERHDGEKMV
jgi:hypothetical protein